ncbi:MAG TPA: hypothetical protein VGM37_08465 [Armatimonadota bacterium]|jgi:hypothetical protein
MKRMPALLLIVLGCAAQAKPMARRWVYVRSNLLVSGNVARVDAILARAHTAGYNGVLLEDYKTNLLATMPPSYFANAKHVLATAQSLGMDLIPTVCPVGYSNGLLSHNPNLAEGMPVIDAPYLVSGSAAALSQDAGFGLKDGGFEQVSGARFTGWGWQDSPVAPDTSVKHSGAQSAKMTGIAGGNARICQTVAVQPHRQYHLSVWLRTQDFDAAGAVNGLAMGADGRVLAYPGWAIAATQDWKQYDLVFNSLGNASVSIYFGAWGGRGGAIWWDDARLEEVGLLNVLRRKGCPLVVKGTDGTVYAEGRDYDRVADPRMGTIPWAGEYEVFHASPPIAIPAGSRIRDGQALRVSFYHAVVVNGEQVGCCLTEPQVYTLLEEQVRRVNELYHPKGFFMSHDEIRVANWCQSCQATGLTPGRLLANCFARCAAMVRKVSPKATVYVWSDMFDPSHNARDSYYLANGTFAGSWNGVPKDVVIANWNSGKMAESLRFYDRRGNPQIIAGYYDGPPDSIKAWLAAASGIKGLQGVIYTTWADNYGDLEAFAAAAWGQTNAAKRD